MHEKELNNFFIFDRRHCGDKLKDNETGGHMALMGETFFMSMV
jgi:hypothetical protein